MTFKLKGIDMRIFTVAAILALAACGPATEATAPDSAAPGAVETEETADAIIEMIELEVDQIGSIDPFENDLRGLEVAIRLRDEFRTQPDGVKFEFAVVNAQGERPLDEAFDLEQTHGVESALIATEQREGFYIRTYKLAEADMPRMGTADATLQALKAASTGGNELHFQAVALTCVEPDVALPDSYSLTLYVRTHTGVDFITLNQEVLLDRSPDGAMADVFGVCED